MSENQKLEQGTAHAWANFYTMHKCGHIAVAVTASVFAMHRSAFKELATPEAMAVITNLVRTQTAIILKQAWHLHQSSH